MMLGRSLLSGLSSSEYKNRTFVYEVAGLRQTDASDVNAYPIRTSDNVFIQVPYSRMNEEMRRITRLGGKIVAIRPASSSAAE